MSLSRFVDVAKWLDQSAAPLDPATMQYRSRLVEEGARDCKGCCFKGQHWRVCVKAAQLAVLAKSNDCDDRDAESNRTHVYVLVRQDERQLALVED